MLVPTDTQASTVYALLASLTVNIPAYHTQLGLLLHHLS